MAKAQLHSKRPSEEKKKPVNQVEKPRELELQQEALSQQNAVANFEQPSPSGVYLLQRTIGNRAVQNLVVSKNQSDKNSTVIQRHVGAFAEPSGVATDSLLNASVENITRGMGAVQSAQGMFQAYRAMAASTPVQAPTEGGTDSGGEGHGYEFDDDVVE